MLAHHLSIQLETGLYSCVCHISLCEAAVIVVEQDRKGFPFLSGIQKDEAEFS